jgi:two-component system, OmpR family, copper resistance phosphate regulon response regulator CusR
MARILLVEDEVNIASFIERGLKELDHEVIVAYDGEKGWEAAQNGGFDFLILDIIMPKMNGLELCSKYRSSFGYKTPVIMLTALGTTEDVVKGLEAGADDYLVKPFSFRELEARMKALLRRTSETNDVKVLKCGDLTLDCNRRKALRGDMDIDLTVTEYRLLEYLMNNQNLVISRMTLLKNVWDKNFDTNTNIVDVYVNYLRGKVDKNFERKLIHTVVGVGYIMSE